MSRQSKIVKLEIAGLKFTWDAAKARANERDHGVAFEEAASCWFDPYKLESYDAEHSTDETRWLLIGTSKLNRLLVCWFTERKINQQEIIRLIGARKVSQKERKRYEEATNK